jgi:urease accessory protein
LLKGATAKPQQRKALQPAGCTCSALGKAMRKMNKLVDEKGFRRNKLFKMLIQAKLGHWDSFTTTDKTVDTLPLEWYETNKRILHKQTVSGRQLTLKFLQESHQLRQGDILWADDTTLIAVDILPCDCLVLQPATMQEMASLCYEIGNKHLPLFYQAPDLLMPFDQPLYQLLTAQGYAVQQQQRRLTHPLRTSVSPHGTAGQDSLFTKIMKLTGA